MCNNSLLYINTESVEEKNCGKKRRRKENEEKKCSPDLARFKLHAVGLLI